MGHGEGIFGMSAANIKGSERCKCEKCGKTWVKGSHNKHNPNGDCPYECPKCGGLNWARDEIAKCPDCGHDLLEEA